MKKILVLHSKGGTGKTTLVAAFADRLKDVSLVDLDPQQSLKVAGNGSGKYRVVTTIAQASQNAKFRIIDTPPYRARVLENLAESSDFIVVPCSEGALDLIAATRTIDLLTKKRLTNKVWLVFTRIRLPLNKTNKQIMRAFREYFPHVNIAKQIVSQRVSYQHVFDEKLTGKAAQEIDSLLTEIGIR